MHFKTILLLDSDVQRRSQIRCSLSAHGYKVLEAANLWHAETICSLREVSIDLVIQDADVPSGFKWPRWRPNAPLLLTVYSSPHVKGSLQDSGRVAFNPEDLMAQVSSALNADTKTVLVDDSAMNGIEPANEPDGKPDPRTPDVAGAHAGTILLVEDDEFLRRTVFRALCHNGFSVLEAADGISAVNLFSAHHTAIKLVLLDIILPGISGRQVFEELVRIQPDVKVILTSAFTPEMATTAMAIPKPRPFLRKPYRITELLRLVREVQGSKA
jgi:DNA-binding response OmpR family regulator